jgi:putative phosphoribosyl transferase
MDPVLLDNRRAAGRQLAERLQAFRHPDLCILALPRGGVPVAYEVALALSAPLDVFLVRKLGAPDQEELAVGAIASGGVCVVNQEIIEILNISPSELASIVDREEEELARREVLYRGKVPPLSVKGRPFVLVDDGLATGATMKAAVTALRRLEPLEVTVAVPVGTPETCREIAAVANGVVSLITPEPLLAVGSWYRDFPQVADEEVQDLLSESAKRFNVR